MPSESTKPELTPPKTNQKATSDNDGVRDESSETISTHVEIVPSSNPLSVCPHLESTSGGESSVRTRENGRIGECDRDGREIFLSCQQMRVVALAIVEIYKKGRGGEGKAKDD